MKIVTLLFLRRENQILLAMKKRGFGAELWNAPGGKASPGETPLQAAVRECQEEIGVTALDAREAGYLQFFMPDDPLFEHRCHVFVATKWKGEPSESEEMRPEWFELERIPYSAMWPADKIWIPRMLTGELFEGIINLTTSEVASYELRTVKKITGGDLRGTFDIPK